METQRSMATQMMAKLQRDEQVTAEEFRHVCGLFPTGVTVVTRRLDDGSPYGMTVSSFTSVSLAPPLVLISIDRAAKFLRELPEEAAFIVNVLSEGQQDVAKRFANRREENRFEGIAWSPDWREVPLLDGLVASFACVVSQVVEAGDHFLLIGAVQRVQQHGGRPLIWCDRDYHYLPRPAST